MTVIDTKVFLKPVFWIVFAYIVGLCIALYMYTEYKYANGVILCMLFLIIPTYFVSTFWTIVAIIIGIAFTSTYYTKRSMARASLVAINILFWAMIPYIYIKYFVKGGESAETDYILSHRLDNLWST